MKEANRHLKAIVRDGYDEVSFAYREDGEGKDSLHYHRWLDEFIPLLPSRSPVLDLGCGCGVPVAARLAQAHEVIGVDISPVQIGRARRNVPGGRFICADMSAVEFAPASFAGIVAFYAIIHLPLDEQPAFLGYLYRWLRPGGFFMATVGHQAWTGQEANWLNAGAAMYWSHADEATYLEWLSGVGFEVLWTRFIPEGNGGHTLLLATR